MIDEIQHARFLLGKSKGMSHLKTALSVPAFVANVHHESQTLVQVLRQPDSGKHQDRVVITPGQDEAMPISSVGRGYCWCFHSTLSLRKPFRLYANKAATTWILSNDAAYLHDERRTRACRTYASMLPIRHAVSEFFAAAAWFPGTRPVHTCRCHHDIRRENH